MKEKSQWRWRSKQVLALAAIISLVPLPVLAGEGNQPTPTKQTLSATAAKVVAREVLKSASDGMEAARSGAPELRSTAYFSGGAPAAAVRAEQEGTPGPRTAAFFKTRSGHGGPRRAGCRGGLCALLVAARSHSLGRKEVGGR